MSTSDALSPVERWLTPALLVVSAALSLVAGDVLHVSPAVLALLTAVAIGWVIAGWWVVRSERGADRLEPGAAAWFAGFAAIMFVACNAAPLFGFAAWTGYVFVTRVFPPRLLWAGALLVAAGTAASQAGGEVVGDASRLPLYLALLVANSAIAGFALWLWLRGETQQREREATLEELRIAHERLGALQEQLVLGAREAGVADERARLAREIHDTIAQGLTGIVRQLEAADGADPAEAARRMATARELARDSLSEARRSVQALRPEVLEAARLPEALGTVAADWSTLHGVPATVTTSGDACRLHPEVDVALLRTAQEALANVGKHARAGRVGVTLTYMGDEVSLDVRDDGVGFDPAATNGSGYGLAAMRERVAAVGGRFAIEAAPGDGAAVSATVPAVPPR